MQFDKSLDTIIETDTVKQMLVFAGLVCTKYLGCYHVIFRHSVSFMPEDCFVPEVYIV